MDHRNYSWLHTYNSENHAPYIVLLHNWDNWFDPKLTALERKQMCESNYNRMLHPKSRHGCLTQVNLCNWFFIAKARSIWKISNNPLVTNRENEYGC